MEAWNRSSQFSDKNLILVRFPTFVCIEPAMSSSSLAVAATAIDASLHSFSSTSVEHHHRSLHIFAFDSKPIKPSLKLKQFYSLSPVTRPFASTTSFDSVELGQEENDDDEEETSFQELASEDSNGVPQSAESGRLYVGNLPFSMTSSELSQIFSEAGRVVSVEILYDKVTDRSRGFGFVTMANADEAKEAIRLFDGAQIGGRTAKVNFPEVPRGGEREVLRPKIRVTNQGFVDSPHKIYAGNLSWGLTSQGLREAFEDLPGFLSAKVVYDRDSGRSRGFGFITFSSAEEVNSALEIMNGSEIEGRPLRLNPAEQKPPVTPQAPAPVDSLESSQALSAVGSQE